MQTAAIAHRVADFLKQHPPFQFIEEKDLVALTARGRVKFHESDEYICWQSSPHTPHVYVIQQGTVALWDESTQPPTLRDIRGAGDSIGIERFNGAATSLYSAKATSEVVIYALSAADFAALLERYPHAAQYVAAYSAVTADYDAADQRAHPHEILLGDLVKDMGPVRCPASTPVIEAARLLSESGAEGIALTGDDGELAAILTPADIVHWAGAGARNPEQPARAIARTPSCTATAKMTVSDCVLAMAGTRASAAALTSDGTASGTLEGIVTASSLAPAFGDSPLAILREIGFAAGFDSLRALHQRARAWILDNLTTPPALDWLASFAAVLNRRMLERIVQLTGNDEPGTLWCFYGGAGRGERLTSVAPAIAVIGPAPASIVDALDACGYLSPEPPVSASLDEWKTRFSEWVRDPIRKQVYHARPFFDLSPVLGAEAPFHALEEHLRAELASEPGFVRLLANDCLANLPPLTFFRDLVIEESGEERDTFRLASSALYPLADVARVFSLAFGRPLGASTRARFEQARLHLPAQESIFREAAETMRLVLFHQARAGLRSGSNGAEIPLSLLSRHDRQVLKSGFRSIHALLEYTADCDWLEAL